jgi:23S rRNA (adenine2503-C2)-methyltransferase
MTAPTQPGRQLAVLGQTRDTRPGLSGLTPAELEAWFVARGERAYRARQVADALWRSGTTDAAAIGTLPAPLRDDLDRDFRFDTLVSTEIRATDAGLTEKALHRLSDDALIESVLMHYPARGGQRERHTLCISSQAGCAVGCPFCATGELGFGRDLETPRSSTRSGAARASRDGRRLTNVVFMGMGEPLLNLDNVLAAVQALADPARFGLGARHVTVSTSGVVPGIRRLTALGPQFTLAVSLHAARDSLRDALVPLNRRWPVVRSSTRPGTTPGDGTPDHVRGHDDLRDQRHAAGRRGARDAARRRPRARQPDPDEPGRPHPVEGEPDPVIERFAARLRVSGISTTIRRNRGQEIGAACGQLAAERPASRRRRVARRRERIVRESAAALRGERSSEPVPAGVGE